MDNDDVFDRIDREWESIKLKHPLLDEVEVVSYWILSKESVDIAENYAKKIENRRCNDK